MKVYPQNPVERYNLSEYSECSKVNVSSTSSYYTLSMTKGSVRFPFEITFYKNDYPGATGTDDGVKIEFFWTDNPSSPSSDDKIGEAYVDTQAVFYRNFYASDVNGKSLVVKCSATGTYLFTVKYYYK